MSSTSIISNENGSRTQLSSIRPQWREAVAGACAGGFSRSVMAPLERLKLLKQLQSTASDNTIRNQSSWKIMLMVYQEQGLLSFWRGNLPGVLRVAGTASINFTCMDYYKKLITGFLRTSTMSDYTDDERSSKFLTSLLAGGMAGATSTTIMYPFEFARTRLAMDMGKDDTKTIISKSFKTTHASASSSTGSAAYRPREYRGMWDVTNKIIQTDGPFGLYRGYGIALFGGIFYRILYLGGYDILKGEMKRRERRGTKPFTNDSGTKLSWTGRVVAAQTISLTAGTLSYPFDSVRRRMMMQAGLLSAAAGNVDAASPKLLYNNSLQCIRHVWRTEGIKGFYLGLGPNMLRSVGGALLLVAYDAFRDILLTK